MSYQLSYKFDKGAYEVTTVVDEETITGRAHKSWDKAKEALMIRLKKMSLAAVPPVETEITDDELDAFVIPSTGPTE